ncbi:ABC transporter ATP-binding protein/permease [Streptomyces murinus]|uniref:ABC transporter transmembrane domain-containing protein n=1 Tax=Streptomyces murinus TaxID=33900 RepID=UPI000A1E2B4B|nr:ABC transporter ATP-binding protein [Streptomyces murinus]WDO04716.1 ABC transporter ATP-binding protein/permease [Streptomyces murinus]
MTVPAAAPPRRPAVPAPRSAAASAPAASPGALLWWSLGNRRRDLLLASALFSTHQLGEALVPVLVGATVGEAVRSATPASTVRWLGLLALDFLLLSLSYRFGARASARARQHTEHRIRMALAERVLRPAGGVRLVPGDLLSRASGDAERVGAFAGALAGTVAAVVVLLGSTVLLLRISLGLGALVVAGTAGVLLAQNRLSHVLRRTSGTEQDRQARATALAEEIVRGLRVLKGIGAERAVAADYARGSREAVRAARRAVSAEGALVSVGVLLTGLCLTAVAAVGGGLALDGRIGLGRLIAVLGLAQFVNGPMRVVGAAHARYVRALASAARVQEVLGTPPAVPEPAAARPPLPPHEQPTDPVADRRTPTPQDTGVGAASGKAPGTLDFREVPLPGGSRAEWSVPAGEMTGLVCADPADADAIALLLAREEDPGGGRILLDGTDLTALRLTALRTTVLVSHHEPVLLPGTVADNLAALTEDTTAVTEAARASFADEVVRALPHGAHTTVGDRGETLSGGQRQRIALGRALAARPPVLVLHDPTTAVDAATEDAIADRVRRIRERRTTLVITTSPAWLARCDRVVHVPATERVVTP